MKRIATSFFVILLSVLVLLGSGRFTIGKMVCMGDHHAVYSLGKATDCCEKNGIPQRSIKSSCCELIDVSYMLDDFSPSSKIYTYADQHSFVVPLLTFKPQASGIRLQPLYSDLPSPDTKARLYSFRSLLL